MVSGLALMKGGTMSGYYDNDPYGGSGYGGRQGGYEGQQAGYGAHASVSPSPTKKASGGVKTFFIAFGGALLACVLALCCYTFIAGGSKGMTTIGSSVSSFVSGSDDSESSLATNVANKCLPSVVAIDVYTASSTNAYGFGSSSSSSGSLTESSLGSGVVLSSDGYIITNYHVIEGADALKVTIEGVEYEASVVGSDPSSDIAVIKAKNASGLNPIEIGSSSSLVVGEWVMSIGSPFGLEQSVATGIVSATSRSQIMSSSSSNSNSYSSGSGSYTIYPNMIQTDAAINPGNSGGALVNRNGQLIGINTLITSYSGNYSGVGFAIPVDYAIGIAEQLIAGKTPTHAQLGVTLSTVNSSNSQRYGLSVSSGAYISSVSSGSGAEKAGIQVGDIVTSFDGTKVTSASDLMVAVRGKNPGDTVSVTLNRNGENKTVDVVLGDDSSSSTTQQQSQNSSSGSSIYNRLFGGGSSGQGNSGNAS